MRLEGESKRLAKLVELGSKLPSLEELERRTDKASGELEKKDEKIAVSFNSFLFVADCTKHGLGTTVAYWPARV